MLREISEKSQEFFFTFELARVYTRNEFIVYT